MPVYEYVCTVCGHPIEVMHSFTATGPTVCTQCGGAMRKALSTPAIVFKGSGWAKKDHRDKVHASSKSAAATAAAPTPGDAASAGAAEGTATAASDSATAGGTTPTASPTPAAATPAAPSTPSAPTKSSSTAGSG